MTMPTQMNQAAIPDQGTTGMPLYVEGAATEDPPDDPSTPFPGLPPGVHPMDPSTVLGGDPVAAQPDLGVPKWAQVGKQPWSTTNLEALNTFERASSDWTANQITVDTNNSGTVQLVGRVKGRKQVIVSIPSVANVASALPVVIAPTEDEVLNGLSGYIVYPGDSPLIIITEAPVWAGVIPGNTTGGPIRVLQNFNPPGGALGAQ